MKRILFTLGLIAGLTQCAHAQVVIPARNIEQVTANEIITLGDSLVGLGYFQTRWQSHLTGWHIVNAGVPGENAAGTAARVGFYSSRGANYAAVLVGINSIAQDVSAATIESSLQSVYTALHNGGAKVVAMTIGPFGGSTNWTSGRQAVLDAVNTWIMNTATNVDFRYDSYTALTGGSGNTISGTYDSGDKVHFNVAGGNVLGDGIHALVGTPTATQTASTRYLVGSDSRNIIYRLGVANIATDAQFSIFDTTEATSLGQAALVVHGGASIQRDIRTNQNIFAGGNITASGSLSVLGGAFTGAPTLPTTWTGASGVGIDGSSPVRRLYFGDGSGYSLALSSRSGGVTTSRHTFADNGDATHTGNLTVTGSTSTNGASSTGRVVVTGTGTGAVVGSATVRLANTTPTNGRTYTITSYDDGRLVISDAGNADIIFVHPASGANPTGMVTLNAPVALKSYAVASLPTGGSVTTGTLAYATDLSSTTSGATAAGGGAGLHLVVFNGANWIVQ